MKFIADLHIHSKYSIATAKTLDLENVYISALLKGITVVGTGDITHPDWFSELKHKLLPAEPGLFKLTDDLARSLNQQIPKSCMGTVRFVLQGEISNIYKKNGKTRKNHSVILLPDMESVARLNTKLEKIGNIQSDGRPILGIDTKDLLNILLDISDQALMIPAHIWTPWFSVLGSKSGFDTIEECFEDLTPYIYAVETGLSSDPPMNWRVSHLDRMTLVSNSDAHSPANLGRNANIFDTDISFYEIRNALKEKNPKKCLGTIDLYPQEGKYHYDGHRGCNICFHPRETMKRNNICPVCGKPLTIGVLYRVEALADRPEGVTPPYAIPCYHIIPLQEIISEILSVGVGSKKVQDMYQLLIEKLGPELNILLDLPIESIDKAGISLFSEAIRRMRSGKVQLSPGYDGEYGKITLFTSEEKEVIKGQQLLFSIKSQKKPIPTEPKTIFKPKQYADVKEISLNDSTHAPLLELNDDQRQAVEYDGSHLCIIAGPGSGKTQTLTRRIAHAITARDIPANHILAVTFTNQAAREMKERLLKLINNRSSEMPLVTTFHGFCYQLLQERSPHPFTIIDDEDKRFLIAQIIATTDHQLKTDVVLDAISLAKQHLIYPNDPLNNLVPSDLADHISIIYDQYQKLLQKDHLLDFDDLIFNAVRLLEADHAFQQSVRDRYQYLFVDEFQDINEGQYRIITALAPREICIIGDPDQSIYGFRGASLHFFEQFQKEYPKTKCIYLSKNYRSTKTILDASYQVIRRHRITPDDIRVYSEIDGVKTITIAALESEKAEAVAIGKMIEHMVGGTGFHSVDFQKIDRTSIAPDHSFNDFAILFRTNAQGDFIKNILEQAGIPCQMVTKSSVYGIKGVSEMISYLKLIEGIASLHDLKKVIQISNDGVSKQIYNAIQKRYIQSELSLNDLLAGLEQFGCIAVAKTIQLLQELTRGQSVAEKLKIIIKQTGLDALIQEDTNRQEVFQKVLTLADTSKFDIKEFFKAIALATDPDMYDIHAEKVTLMTMHSSKGREFPIVFIAGCENGFIPYHRSELIPSDIAEERRLFYVAMTRAKENLILTYAKKRTIFGKQVQREPSPFISDIETQLIHLKKDQVQKRKKESFTQIPLF